MDKGILDQPDVVEGEVLCKEINPSLEEQLQSIIKDLFIPVPSNGIRKYLHSDTKERKRTDGLFKQIDQLAEVVIASNDAATLLNFDEAIGKSIDSLKKIMAISGALDLFSYHAIPGGGLSTKCEEYGLGLGDIFTKDFIEKFVSEDGMAISLMRYLSDISGRINEARIKLLQNSL